MAERFPIARLDLLAALRQDHKGAVEANMPLTAARAQAAIEFMEAHEDEFFVIEAYTLADL